MKSRADLMLAVLAIAAFVLVAGCATDKSRSGYDGKASVLRGMVYNEDRRPVQDVSVEYLVDGKPAASVRTDVHGRFAIPEVPFGAVSLRLSKEKYETLPWSFSFDGPTQVVYAKMTNLSELMDAAAAAMQKRDWPTASSALERARGIEGTNVVVAYLEAEMLALRGSPAEAAAAFEKLSAERAPSFAIELALGDLYQYQLAQPDKALEHLRKALALKGDIDIEGRITELEKGK